MELHEKGRQRASENPRLVEVERRSDILISGIRKGVS
jgi:hypothetical protein